MYDDFNFKFGLLFYIKICQHFKGLAQLSQSAITVNNAIRNIANTMIDMPCLYAH